MSRPLSTRGGRKEDPRKGGRRNSDYEKENGLFASKDAAPLRPSTSYKPHHPTRPANYDRLPSNSPIVFVPGQQPPKLQSESSLPELGGGDPSERLLSGRVTVPHRPTGSRGPQARTPRGVQQHRTRSRSPHSPSAGGSPSGHGRRIKSGRVRDSNQSMSPDHESHAIRGERSDASGRGSYLGGERSEDTRSAWSMGGADQEGQQEDVNQQGSGGAGRGGDVPPGSPSGLEAVSSYKEVDFAVDSVTHQYSWPGGDPEKQIKLDFSLPPSQMEYEDVVQTMANNKVKLALPFSEMDLWRYVFTGSEPGKGGRPLSKEERTWEQQIRPERNLAGRQDVLFLLNRLQDQLMMAGQKQTLRLQKLKESGPNKWQRPLPPEGFSHLSGQKEEPWWDDPKDVPDKSDYEFMREQIQIFSNCTYELCQQVSVQCAERGRLLGYCWHRVSKMFLAVLDELNSLHHSVSIVDQLKEELQERFRFSQSDVKRQYDYLKDSMVEARKKAQMAQIENAELRTELEDLKNQVKKMEALEQMEDRCYDLEQQVRAAKDEKVTVESMMDRYKDINVELERTLMQNEQREKTQNSEVANMRLQMRELTPRLPRQYEPDYEEPSQVGEEGAALARSRTRKNQVKVSFSDSDKQVLEPAFISGMRLETLVRVLTAQEMKDYIKYLGMLKTKVKIDQSVTWEQLHMKFIDGEIGGLKEHISGTALQAAVDVLHHGMPPESAVMLLTGLSPWGEDFTGLVKILGKFPISAADQLHDQLRRASRTNKERFDDLHMEVDGLRGRLQAKEDRVAFLEKEIEGLQRKMEHVALKAGQPLTPLQKFLASEEDTHCVGLGTASNIPQFLRYKGKVKNLKFTKAQTEQLIKEVWTDKAAVDKGKKQTVKLNDHLHAFFTKKFPNPADNAEQAYSMMRALSKYSDDADVELFLTIILGDVSEEVYYEQLELVNEVTAALVKADVAANKKAIGLLSKDQLHAVLVTYFSTKKPERVEELFALLEEEFPEAVVEYNKLFEEDENFNQGDFAEAVKDQNLVERLEYLAELELAMHDHANEEGQVDIPRATKAFQQVDPTITKPMLKVYIQRCFKGLKGNKAVLEVSAAMSRLKKGVLKKSPKKNVTTPRTAKR